MVPPLLLLLLLAGFPPPGEGNPIQLVIANWQPLQPFDSWGGPCRNITDVDKNGFPKCSGGLPAIDTVMRHLCIREQTCLKIGAMEQNSRLIFTHTDFLKINDDMFGAAGVEMMFLTTGALTSSTRQKEMREYFYENAKLPTVLSNLRESEYPFLRSAFEHYFIKQFDNGIRLAVICAFPSNFFLPTMKVSKLRSLVDRLRASYRADIVVLTVSPRTDGLDKMLLIEGETGVDLALLTTSFPDLNGGVNISRTPSGAWAADVQWIWNSVAAISLGIDPVAKKITSVSVNVTGVQALPPAWMDERYRETQDLVQKIIDKAEEADDPIGISANPMPHGFITLANGSFLQTCRSEECALGVLMTTALHTLLASEAEVVFMNGGAMRRGWDVGEVKRKHFNDAYPFTTLVCYLNVTGAGLLRALRHSVDAIGTDGEYNSSELVTGHFLQVAGMRYTFNPKLPKENRITSVSILTNGKYVPLSMTRMYRAVTGNFLCSGGDGYKFDSDKDTMSMTQQDAWPYLTEYFGVNSPYTATLNGNIRTDDGEPLDLIKTAEECGKYARYLPEWEACEPCVEGYYHPVPGEEPCIIEPPSDSGNTVIVVLVVIGTLLLIALAAAGRYVLFMRRRLLESLRNAPESGIVTFVFTDVQASTALWQNVPNAMSRALAEHDRIIRANIELCEGYEVKTIGDSFMVAFKDCSNAVMFSMRIQMDLLEATWPEELKSNPACRTEVVDGRVIFAGLRVRAGVHVGPATAKRTPQGGVDYEGSTVNIAARVGNSGAGGQTVITEEVYDLVQESLNDLDIDMEVTFLGQYEFKGINSPVTCLHILPTECVKRASFFRELRDCHKTEEAKIQEDVDILVKEMSVESMESVSKVEKMAAVEALRRTFRSGMSVEALGQLLATIVDLKEMSVARLSQLLVQAVLEAETGQKRTNQGNQSTSRSSARTSVGTPTRKTVSWASFVVIMKQLPDYAVIHLASTEGFPIDDLQPVGT